MTTKYEIHVLMDVDSKGTKAYKAIRPTNGLPYQYDTKQKAQDVAEICYPDHMHLVKIVEVNK